MGNYLQIFIEVYKFGYRLTWACRMENYQEAKLFGWGKRVRGPRPFTPMEISISASGGRRYLNMGCKMTAIIEFMGTQGISEALQPSVFA